jgi:hypothetical protein
MPIKEAARALSAGREEAKVEHENNIPLFQHDVL